MRWPRERVQVRVYNVKLNTEKIGAQVDSKIFRHVRITQPSIRTITHLENAWFLHESIDERIV